jgi:hypothetical protein
MPWEIQYYSESVRRDVEIWPVGIRAMYARITERMQVLGPHLGMPFIHPMGEGLRYAPKAKRALAEHFSAPLLAIRS